MHLGYDKQDPVGRNQGNSRNGKPAQDCVNSGEVAIEVPHDGDGGFEPLIVTQAGDRCPAATAKTVLLILGAPQTGHAWRKVVSTLVAAGYQVVVPTTVALVLPPCPVIACKERSA